MSDKNTIEQDFDSVMKQIQDQLKEAAEKIKAANDLAKTNFGASLGYISMGEFSSDKIAKKFNMSEEDADQITDDMYELSYPLINAMKKSGWQTSSLSC